MPPKVPEGWSQYNLVWPNTMRQQVDVYRAMNGFKDLREATLDLIEKGLEAARKEGKIP